MWPVHAKGQSAASPRFNDDGIVDTAADLLARLCNPSIQQRHVCIFAWTNELQIGFAAKDRLPHMALRVVSTSDGMSPPHEVMDGQCAEAWAL